MLQIIELFSAWWATFIIVLCAAHLIFFLVLWIWGRRDLRHIASVLDDFTRHLKHRSILDQGTPLSDQIEAFLADINEVLDDASRTSDRAVIFERIRILDEKRRFLSGLNFETCYNVCRTMIESYTLLGILGTIMAIGAALQASATAGDVATVNTIVTRFGESIWCTFAGLIAAILLMFVNSLVEPGFARLGENRRHIREMVARAKRELSLRTAEPR